ncbi:MAG: hypothetical protein J3R72DRAFT_429035, partial [Linnemannia gamsii]
VEADVENMVKGLTDLVYFSDPYYKRPSRQRWREDCARKEFWTSFEVCPWLYDEDRQQDVEEEEGEDVEERLSGPESRTGPVQSALVQLLYQNQHLKNLTLFGTVNLQQYEQNHDNTSADPLIVSRWLEALPKSLETLSMDTPWSRVEKGHIGRQRPTFSPSVKLTRMRALNIVSVDHIEFGYNENATNLYGDLMRCCPNLEALRLPVCVSPQTQSQGEDGDRDGEGGSSSWDWEQEDFAQIISECCPRLTTLYIDGQTSDEQYAQLLRASRLGWRTVKISDGCSVSKKGGGWRTTGTGTGSGMMTRVGFGAQAMEALLEHATTLVNVRLQDCDLVSSASIQRLLCTADRLKKFHVLVVSHLSYVEGASLDARDLVESEWVCLGLESFACRITHIPRPDLKLKGTIEEYSIRTYLKDPSYIDRIAAAFSLSSRYTIEESHRFQGRVYNQLARLTHLQELVLGKQRFWAEGRYRRYHNVTGPTVLIHNNNNNNTDQQEEYEDCRQQDGLSMSLASGMDVLKGLKQLRRVGLAGMPNGFRNVEETAWKMKWWDREVKVEIVEEVPLLHELRYEYMFMHPRWWGFW